MKYKNARLTRAKKQFYDVFNNTDKTRPEVNKLDKMEKHLETMLCTASKNCPEQQKEIKIASGIYSVLSDRTFNKKSQSKQRIQRRKPKIINPNKEGGLVLKIADNGEKYFNKIDYCWQVDQNIKSAHKDWIAALIRYPDAKNRRRRQLVPIEEISMIKSIERTKQSTRINLSIPFSLIVPERYAVDIRQFYRTPKWGTPNYKCMTYEQSMAMLKHVYNVFRGDGRGTDLIKKIITKYEETWRLNVKNNRNG